jgi:hypothetical protein
MTYRTYLRLALVVGLVIVAFTFSGSAGASPSPASDIIGACYLPDTPFPQFINMWEEGWDYRDDHGSPVHYATPDMKLGGYAFVYYKNPTNEPIKIVDLTLQGVKMSEGLAQTHFPKGVDERFQASILLSDLPKTEIAKLVAAGTPVWWKPEPMNVPAGGVAEIVIRMRRDPSVKELKLGIVTDKGTTIPATLWIGPSYPKFRTISFSPDLKTAYLYTSRRVKEGLDIPEESRRPVKILMDGKDVTSLADIKGVMYTDGVAVVRLKEPLPWMSYHIFQAVYSDGSQAVAGIRAWGREMVYGIWGVSGDMGDTEESAKAQLKNWTTHSMNAIMGMYPGTNNQWFIGPDGWKYSESIGVTRMMHYLAKDQTPLYFFLMDEPDACDTHTEQVPFGDRLGTSGQWLVKWHDMFHRKSPNTPTLLNVDGTYKPENYYMYHQLPDIPCIDPYFQGDLDLVYQKFPGSAPMKTRPTPVYAASLISQSAGAPKPLHVILTCAKGIERYPTPEEKRLEVYYAIAAGAKGLSYWWYTPMDGVGSGLPGSKALWKEMGLLGTEVRTASSIITEGCPVDFPTTATRWLWVRTLLHGTDTLATIVLNDNFLNDRLGSVYKPVENASVTVITPSWLKAKDVFEVSYQGIKDVKWTQTNGKLALDLGKVDLSRFVIATSDPTLRSRFEQRYKTMFADNVTAMLAGD